MGASAVPDDLDLFMRWESDLRYYLMRLQVNLFGDLELHRAWGGLGSRNGGNLTELVPDLEAGRRRLHREESRRINRGYTRIGQQARWA